ncbi:MAG: hypothetical protein ABJA16_12115 [Nakamurella sp.]
MVNRRSDAPDGGLCVGIAELTSRDPGAGLTLGQLSRRPGQVRSAA